MEDGGLVTYLSYDPDRYSADEIERIGATFVSTLRGMTRIDNNAIEAAPVAEDFPMSGLDSSDLATLSSQLGDLED